MRRYFPHLLSFLVGYISLSQEILWVRIFGFANHSLPQAFGVVVVCYLVGIALGAEWGKRFCDGGRNLWQVSGCVMLVSLAIDAACFYSLVLPAFLDPQVGLFAVPLLIVLVAGGKAVLFPIAHHLGTIAESGKVGRSMSMVYLCNILGSTMGPLVTGLFLLSFLTTQQCIFLLLGLSGLTSFFCFSRATAEIPGPRNVPPAPPSGSPRRSRIWPCVALVLSAAAFLCIVAAKDILYYKLGDKRSEPGPTKVIETRNGVVSLYGSVSGAPGSDDAVLGGNVYDGRTNLDLQRNTNLIDREVILAAVQSHPTRVLMIGLSIGTWLTLIDTFPGIESIDVVEINEGYLKAIPYYPEQERTLHDPRVHVFIDDGHRWLTAHPSARYDLIVMNTTYYWRNFTSNLLSREFLTEVSRHMNKGAVLTYNSTEAPDVLKTASVVFNFARRRKSFILASDHDFTFDLRSKESFDRVFSLKLGDRRLFPESTENLLHAYVDEPLVTPQEEEKRAGRPLEVITQDNMLTEFKYGRPLFTPIVRHLYRKLGDYVAGLGGPHGPLDLELRLPTTDLGQYEPLVVVPNRDGGAVVVIVHYADATHIRLGYFQTGMIHRFTVPIETDYAKPHALTVALGAILPPYTDSASYRGWTQSAIEASRQEVVLSWDGREVFRYALDFGDRENWYRPIVGTNTVVQGVSGTSFTGEVLAQKRDPLTAPSP
jgi:spermidine synthase